MFRLLKLIALLFLLMPHTGFAKPYTIETYNTITPLEKAGSILFHKGDSDIFRESSYNDLSWETASHPSNWTKKYPGYTDISWYRIHIIFPDKIPINSYGIQLGRIINSDETYFNGTLIGSSGDISSDRSIVYDRTRIYEIPASLIKPGLVNILAVRVKGYFPDASGLYGGQILAGPFNALQRDYILSQFMSIPFVIIYLAVGLYFLISFTRITDGREYLYFSLFTITTAAYITLRTEVKYLISDEGYMFKKAEYLILILIFVFLMLFVTYFIKKSISRPHYLFFAVSALCFAGISVSDSVLVWKNFLYYGVHISWVIPVGYIIYYFVKYYKEKTDSRYLFAGLMLAMTTMVNDMLVTWNVYDFPFLSGYSFMFVIIAISVVMYKRFTYYYQRSIEQGPSEKKTSAINQNLMNKLNSALEILTENYNTEITREEIAERISINPDTLGKIFKKHTSMTISDYKNDLRIKEAVRLLKTTDHNIIDIAYTVGFENLSSFYRIFQKTVGRTPNSIRDEKES